MKQSFFPLEMKQKLNGFSLIEAVVGVAIIGIIGLILSDLLSRGFKGSNKTQVIGVIKQNGQAAMSLVDRTVRNSSKVVCANSSNDTITVQKMDGNYTRFKVIVATPAASGYLFQDNPVTDYTSFNPVNAVNLCDSSLYPGTNQTRLTDQGSVSIKSGSGFRWNSSFGNKDVVTIILVLGLPTNLGGDYSTQISIDQTFQTTVQLR